MAIELTLIALPRGHTSDGLVAASVVVSPRLTGGTLLGDFPAILDWTAALQATPPRITLRLGGAEIEATFDPSVLRPDIWAALFNELTPVESFVFDDASKRPVISYRVRDAIGLVKETYQSMTMTASGDLPDATFMARMVAGLALPDEGLGIDDFNRETRRNLLKRQSEPSRRDLSPLTTEQTLRDFNLFSRMPQPSPDAPDPVPRSEKELAEIIDFHKAITAITAHPALMRALGLVLDVTMKPDALPLAGIAGMPLAAFSVSRFGHRAIERAARIVTPSVLARHHSDAVGTPVFAACDDPGDAHVVEGWLALPEDAFHLVDLDIDGALAKLIGLATMSGRAKESPTSDGALPALRSAGLSLVAHDRGGETIETLRRSAAINAALGAGPQTVLRARDLVRGYRIDIWSAESGRWRSLHRRRSAYAFGEEGSVKLETAEEGYAQFAAASPAADPARVEEDARHPVQDDLYVHEAIARWTGWSLSAPRPGRPIHRSDPHDPLKKDESEDAFATAFKMRTSFRPEPRSLPKLRFGHRYRVRVRVVDIAGNSPEPREELAGPAHVAVALPSTPDAQPYFRYEPVPHPLLVLHNAPETERPALDRIVIRSFNSDPSLDGVASTETDDRHIAPPRAAVDLVERHGLLDDNVGRLKGDAATFTAFVARDDAAFPTLPIGEPAKETPIVAGDRLTVDYSPDPLALAAAFRNLPGVEAGRVAFAGQSGTRELTDGSDPAAGPVFQVGFGGSWPQRQAFRIELAEGDAPPSWDPGRRVLTVSLPKGSVATSRLSAAFSDRDLPMLGVWAWQREYLDAEARRIMQGSSGALADRLERHTALAGRLLRLALEGGQWALTPSVPVQFIHAVQQPIGLPRFIPSSPETLAAVAHDGGLSTANATVVGAPLIALRESRSPDAMLIGGLDIHLASTGRIDIQARWRDISDTGDSPDGVEWTDARAAIEAIQLGTMQGTVPAQGQTNRKVATITPAGTLAFRPRPAAAPVQHFADTRHRIVTYAATATTRFETDFPADQNLAFTRTGPEVTISVPSSAPPPAPVIVCVLPSFGWRRERAGTLTASIRSGQAIRVYLERPWFSSGEGELLGVVLWPRNSTPPTDIQRRDRYAGMVTEWGLDPSRRSGRLASMPSFTQMRDTAATRESVFCRAINRSVDIVGYETHFDAERGLRYADIVFAADTAYMPFVRLALVRFQPDSISGAEISTVATADFLQLTPDRAAMLIADPSLPNLYRLTVSGLAPTPSLAAPWRNRIEVTLEERIEDVATDLGWRAAAGGIAEVTETTPGSSEPAVLYSGLVEFGVRPAANRYRLAIREFETWEVDPLRFRAIPFDLSITGQAGTPRNLMLSNTGAGVRPAPPIRPATEIRQTTGASATARAIGRLGSILAGPPTKRRLVYAEFLAVDPPAGTAPSSADGPIGGSVPGTGTDIGIGGGQPGEEEPQDPGVGMIDPSLLVDEDPPWPPDAGPETAPLAPRWEDQPELEADGAMEPDGIVKLAQAMLNGSGLLPVALPIDGVFGPAMEAAVRLLRQQTMLADDAILDSRTWTALAIAAPFPVLEPGLAGPAMRGPTVALVQRLLNISSAEPIPEDSVYSPATQARVSSFQAERGLAETGIIGPETWNEIATLFDRLSPAGAEQIRIHFERAAYLSGDGGVEIERIDTSDVALPAPEGDESWTDRSGLWIELQDAAGRVLFRHVFGFSLASGLESMGNQETGTPRRHVLEPVDAAYLIATVPKLAAARRLVLYANVDPEEAGPATPIAIFENW